MELTNEFVIDRDIEETWKILNDLEFIADLLVAGVGGDRVSIVSRIQGRFHTDRLDDPSHDLDLTTCTAPGHTATGRTKRR